MARRTRWVTRAALTAVLAAAALSPLVTLASAGWSPSALLSLPTAFDILPAQIAFSAAGAGAVAFGLQDAEVASVSAGFVIRLAPGGAPEPVPGAQEVLALSFLGPIVELLGATSPAGQPCCGSVEAIGLGAGGGFGAPQTLLRNLTGAAEGRLVTLTNRRALAVIATRGGVWVAPQLSTGRFAPARELASPGAQPEGVAAIALPGAGSLVAWTEAGPARGAPGPRRLLVAGARSGVGGRPGRRRVAVTVAPGHSIDALALAPRRREATVAFIQSWYDRQGQYRSQAMAADISRAGVAGPGRALSSPADSITGLSLAADRAGDLLAVWSQCGRGCEVHASSRAAGRDFGRPVAIGPVDATEVPRVAVAAGGEALIGAVSSGRVLVRRRAAGGASRRSGYRFGPPRTLSQTSTAGDLALAFGPTGTAFAAWTEGTSESSVVGALYRTR